MIAGKTSEPIDEHKWPTEYLLREECQEERGMTMEEARAYVSLEEGQEEVRQMLNKITGSVITKTGDKKVLVEVKYGDHEHPDIEHGVMPHLTSVVAHFSHH